MSDFDIDEAFEVLPEDRTEDFLKLDYTTSTFDTIDELDSFIELQKRISRTPVPKPLETGNLIIVSGTIDVDCERFAINLMCGPTSDDDIALHINPRFSQRYLVRNHRTRGKWGPEATTGVRLFDVHPGKPFILSILVTEIEYMIAINNKHYCTFPFKIPVKKVMNIEVHGAVVVDKIEFTSAKVYPSSCSVADTPVLEYNVPYENVGSNLPHVVKLQQPFKPGQDIKIQGTLKLLPVSFAINLQNSCAVWPHPIIPLHINARFAQKAAEIFLVRNSWNGQWSAEERSVSRQFIPGRPLNLIIRCEPDTYTIWSGSNMVANFSMRLNPNMATYLFLEGDIKVTRILHSESVEELFTNDNFEQEPIISEFPNRTGSHTDVSSGSN